MNWLFVLPVISASVSFLLSTSNKSYEGIPKFDIQEIDGNIAIGYGLEIGDVDGDGNDDILLADKTQIVWYRNPDWQRFVMVDQLTERDNVCIAARDINGDGQVEVAVGAQWNPGETSDPTLSGSVHYLIRPADPTQLWEAIKLHHEPTVHRMRWVKAGDSFNLVVLPLHGRGNRNGEGEGVNVMAYQVPEDPRTEWSYSIIDKTMRQTHNFDVVEENGKEALWIGGKEGVKIFQNENGKWRLSNSTNWLISDNGFGEIRKGKEVLAGIQPMHGNELVVYTESSGRKLLTDQLKQGHALACIDLLSQGYEQVVAGWREKNDEEVLGIKIFVSEDPEWTKWTSFWIDQDGMACEDLKVADLDGDGKMDIIAAGRSTRNLRIYWNKS
ncbi:MAG: VCBS repeat-containing protein [Bacteroidetes bacterium]|nr:VCBS repeat-containing protein [Bacteroidota bacterium]MDA1122215.1 VCBS repeat-containing protein [Bacteroidota bacterium]